MPAFPVTTLTGVGTVFAVQTMIGPGIPIVLDTTISTPIISGPSEINVSAGSSAYLNIPITILNLDVDAVLCELNSVMSPAPGAVFNLHSFVNNGNGTGTFLVDFSSLFAFADFKFSIRVRDNVNNFSAYSNELTVRARIVVDKQNNKFTLAPSRPIHAETCDRLLDGVPESSFIVTGQFIVPYSYNVTSFDLNVTVPGTKISIQVTRTTQSGEITSNITDVIPAQTKTIVYLDLGLGKNHIVSVDEAGNREYIIVAATHYATILCADAREIFNHTQVILDEQTDAIFSKTSTRLAEPLINFIDLLPDVRSQQILATKLSVNALVNNPGNSKGVTDLIKALTLNTPIYVQNANDLTMFEPVVYPLFNDPEHFGGVDVHTWPANTCLGTWIAFNKFLLNLGFKIVSISEREVVFEDENGDRQAHQFDFFTSECSLTDLILGISCFDNIQITLQFIGALYITFCAAMYPFDICINEFSLLGQERPTFDSSLDQIIEGLGNTIAGTKRIEVAIPTFLLSDIGKSVEVMSGVDAGTYTIDTYISSTKVTVIRGSNFSGSVNVSIKLTRPNPYVIGASTSNGDTLVGTKQIFVPVTDFFELNDIGRQIEVVIGPDAGVYTIDSFIDQFNVTVSRPSNFTGFVGGRIHLVNYFLDFDPLDPGADGYLGVCVIRILWDSIEKTFANGTTVAATSNITTSAAFFNAGDVGKSITVETGVDAGTYAITVFNSTTSVTTDRSPAFAGSTPIQIHVAAPIGENTLDSYGAIPGLYFASEFPYITGATVVSTTTTTRVVTLSGIDLVAEGVNSGEYITFLGTSNANVNGKTFVVESVLTTTTLRVREPIETSTGGTANFTHTCVYHGYRVGMVDLASANIPVDATSATNFTNPPPVPPWGSLRSLPDGTIVV